MAWGYFPGSDSEQWPACPWRHPLWPRCTWGFLFFLFSCDEKIRGRHIPYAVDKKGENLLADNRFCGAGGMRGHLLPPWGPLFLFHNLRIHFCFFFFTNSCCHCHQALVLQCLPGNFPPLPFPANSLISANSCQDYCLEFWPICMTIAPFPSLLSISSFLSSQESISTLFPHFRRNMQCLGNQIQTSNLDWVNL